MVNYSAYLKKITKNKKIALTGMPSTMKTKMIQAKIIIMHFTK